MEEGHKTRRWSRKATFESRMSPKVPYVEGIVLECLLLESGRTLGLEQIKRAMVLGVSP